MKFVEAFNSLGYKLDNHQNEWSAEKNDGVCITLWQKENTIDDVTRLPVADLLSQHCSNADWLKKSANQKRKRHISRALKEFNGRIDVVILTGSPGESYENAEPWNVADRQNRHWHISEFDEDTGLFRAEIAPLG